MRSTSIAGFVIFTRHIDGSTIALTKKDDCVKDKCGKVDLQ